MTVDRKYLMIPLAFAGITTAAMGQTWDLAADWSDAANPNGPWSYNKGAVPLPSVASWVAGGFVATQPAWAVAGSGVGHIPSWLRLGSLPVNTPACGTVYNWDACVGDVIMHSFDYTNGGAFGDANVTWTSPVNGVVAISGAVWMVRDIGRSNYWYLYKNSTQLASGYVSSGDPFERSNPQTLASGTTPGALDAVPVIVGDVLRLEFSKGSLSGDFTGMTLHIDAPVLPSGCGTGSVGAGAGGPFDVLRINGTSGAPSRQVDVPLGGPFTISVQQPPTSAIPAQFVIAGRIGIPSSSELFPIPAGIGTMCFTPWLADPANPLLFGLSSSLPAIPALLPAVPAPWILPIPGGLLFPLTATLQGIVEEAPGVFRTTNGIVLKVQ